MFPDVPAALARWRDARAADRDLLVGQRARAAAAVRVARTAGDLTPLIDGFFDTGVGAKASPTAIAASPTRSGRRRRTSFSSRCHRGTGGRARGRLADEAVDGPAMRRSPTPPTFTADQGLRRALATEFRIPVLGPMLAVSSRPRCARAARCPAAAMLEHFTVPSDGHPMAVWARRPPMPRGTVPLRARPDMEQTAGLRSAGPGLQRSVMQSFAAQGFAAYAMDLRGYGETPRDATGWLTPRGPPPTSPTCSPGSPSSTRGSRRRRSSAGRAAPRSRC